MATYEYYEYIYDTPNTTATGTTTLSLAPSGTTTLSLAPSDGVAPVYVWKNWLAPYGTSHNDTWRVWTAATSSAITVGGTQWVMADAGTAANDYVTAWRQWNANYIPRSGEQQAEEAERLRVAQAQWEEREAQRRLDHLQATARAEALLHEELTPEQARILADQRRFLVRAESGRVYEIMRGHHGNVYELDPKTNKRMSQLCVYPMGGLPEGDCMLAQKLHIEHNEQHFRRVANITPIRAA